MVGGLLTLSGVMSFPLCRIRAWEEASRFEIIKIEEVEMQAQPERVERYESTI